MEYYNSHWEFLLRFIVTVVLQHSRNCSSLRSYLLQCHYTGCIKNKEWRVSVRLLICRMQFISFVLIWRKTKIHNKLQFL